MPLLPPAVGAVYPKNGIWFLANRFPPAPHNHHPPFVFDSAWWSRRRVSVRNSSDSRFNVPSPCYALWRPQAARGCMLPRVLRVYLFAGPTRRRILPGLPPNPSGFSSWNPARTLVDCGCGPCLFADATKSCTHQSASAGCCWVPSVKSASFDNCVRDLPTTPLWPPLSKWSQSTAAC
jgi:hypothetical protein